MKHGNFINCSNHPSQRWASAQKQAAEVFGPVVDVPFPQVPPTASAQDISRMADELAQAILSHNPVAVMIQGEMTLTFATVRRLQRHGVLCLAACSERRAVETTNPDGTVSKRVVFDFVQFRPYEEIDHA